MFNKPADKGTGLNLSLIIISAFAALLALCNIHFFTADDAARLCYDAAALASGEWWRIITYSFVHVSWYHLVLDVAAVATLWHEIKLPSLLQKLLLFFCCSACSLVAAASFSPIIDQYGLCGLSGTAHGLMFFLGLWWITGSFDKKGSINGSRLIAGIALAGISGLKSLSETIIGNVLFSSMHTGDLGIPIVESHLGGIAGGLIAFFLFSISRNNA